MNKDGTFNEILKANGLKSTKHRNSILKLLKKSSQPITAEDIYFLLKQENISINLSSIYRILDDLTEISLITKLNFMEKNKTLYEIKTKEHKHHLICSNCKKVFPIKTCPLSTFEISLSAEMDFQITSHNLEIYGYCKNCR